MSHPIDVLRQVVAEYDDVKAQNKVLRDQNLREGFVYAHFKRKDLEDLQASDLADMLRYDQAGVFAIHDDIITIFKIGELGFGGKPFTLDRWQSFGITILSTAIFPEFKG